MCGFDVLEILCAYFLVTNLDIEHMILFEHRLCLLWNRVMRFLILVVTYSIQMATKLSIFCAAYKYSGFLPARKKEYKTKELGKEII